jgi:hypothetical protein
MESFDLVKKFLATDPVKSHCLNTPLITYLEQLLCLYASTSPFFIQQSLPYDYKHIYSSKQLQITGPKATYGLPSTRNAVGLIPTTTKK